MALSPIASYPGRVASPNTAYPLGSARNATFTGDPAATPSDEDWLNDIWGLLQALLGESGVTAAGTPDTSKSSQYLEALRVLCGATFPTVADMVASESLAIGQRVVTLGYNAVNDGGAAVYRVIAAATGVDDGGQFIDLDTHQAELIHNGSVSLEQYGAVGDGVADDTARIVAAFAAFDTIHTLTGSTYLHTGLFISGPKTILGEGVFKLADGSNTDSIIISGFGSKIDGIRIDGNKANQTSGCGIRVGGIADRSTVINCEISNAKEQGVIIDTSSYVSVQNNMFFSPDGAAIRLRSNGVGVDDYNTIIGNRVFGTVLVDFVEDSSGSVGNNNVARGNTGGSAGAQYDLLDIRNDVREIVGTGEPETNVTAGAGSVFHRTDNHANDGPSLYVKTDSGIPSDALGWRALGRRPECINASSNTNSDTWTDEIMDNWQFEGSVGFSYNGAGVWTYEGVTPRRFMFYWSAAENGLSGPAKLIHLQINGTNTGPAATFQPSDEETTMQCWSVELGDGDTVALYVENTLSGSDWTFMVTPVE